MLYTFNTKCPRHSKYIESNLKIKGNNKPITALTINYTLDHHPGAKLNRFNESGLATIEITLGQSIPS
ncbi:MAG: hypothetical protein ACTSRA_01390 [Promethearchaeota archaeon]